MNLYHLLKDDFGSVQITNKTHYKKFPNMKSLASSFEDIEELEKEFDMQEDEVSCIVEWYLNGLASRTDFMIINQNGEVERSKLLVIS